MEQHILVLNKTSLNNNNTCYSLTSCRKLQKNLFYLHLVKEVCASKSSVILQSLHTLLQCNMYIKDHFINGTFFLNFNTDKFKACAGFLKQWINPSITSGGNNDYVIKGWNIRSPACLWQVVFFFFVSKVMVLSDLCLMDIQTLGCINRITLAMVITEQMKFLRDMADHIMKHTQCGQFLLSGYAFWISVTIK